jgi:diguanylate cyclase (GGDEF)-like protein
MLVRRFANSILFRLLLGAFGIVLLGAVMRYTLLTDFLRKDLENVVSAQQLALATYVAEDIDQRLRLRQSLLASMAKTLPPELLRHPDRLRAWLAERHDLLPLFSLGVMVIGRDGKVLADYPALPGRIGHDFSRHPDFAEARDGKSGIGRPEIGHVSKQPALPFAESIRDADGGVRGVLVGVVALNAPGMLDTLQNGRIGETGGFLLISPTDALFVSASDPAMILKPTPPPGVNPLHDRAIAGYRGTGITLNAKGIEELSAMVSVPSTGWFVVARIPTAEAFATVGRTRDFVLRNSLVVAGIALLLVVLIAWRLFKPLFDAARHAEQMTRGTAPLEPLKVARDDEVGHLTTAFNRLLLKLLGSQAELERMAHHDSLTGLPNRRLLIDRMTQALARARRNKTRVAALFMDLDGFKPINDTLGHEAGDEALRVVAKRFTQAIRQSDTLARMGGDEFVLLACDLDGLPDAIRQIAETIAGKCLALISEPLTLQEQPVRLGVSIGIALCDEHCTPDSLLNAADNAMYEAKRMGRGCYVVASPA